VIDPFKKEVTRSIFRDVPVIGLLRSQHHSEGVRVRDVDFEIYCFGFRRGKGYRVNLLVSQADHNRSAIVLHNGFPY
jgi:hypothetical protein